MRSLVIAMTVLSALALNVQSPANPGSDGSTPPAGRSEVLRGAFVNGAPDPALRARLVDAATKAGLRPFVIAIARAGPESCENADKPADVGAWCVVAPEFAEGGEVALRIGPLLVAQEDLLPAEWRTMSVVTTREELGAARLAAQGTLAPAWAMTGALPPEILAAAHHAAIAALDDANIVALGTLPRLPPPYLGIASALDIAIWLECRDAEQLALRAAGKASAADAIVDDMRSMLRAIGAHRLAQRLDEEVPQGSVDRRSLTSDQRWPLDAWELVDAAARGKTRHERVRQEFVQLAARVSAEFALPKPVEAELEKRLATVASKLPPSFEWTGAFERAVRSHVGDALDPSGGDGVPPGSASAAGPWDPDADEQAGKSRAARAAWDVYGFAWNQDGMLLPSEVRRRAQQRETVSAEFDAILEARAISPVLRRAILGEATAALGDPWRPWTAFPFDPQEFRGTVLPAIRSELEVVLDALASMPDSVSVHSARDSIDIAFAFNANVAGRARNQPFRDAGVSYVNGVRVSGTD